MLGQQARRREWGEEGRHLVMIKGGFLIELHFSVKVLKYTFKIHFAQVL